VGFQSPSWVQGHLRRSAIALVSCVALAAIGATIDSARAQQYFNGAQITPNATINGGNGVWDNTTTNWTNAAGTVSSPYDPSAGTITVFGASGPPTPATAGTVTVAPGGVQLTGDVQFQATGDSTIYTIQGGNLTVATGGATFEIGSVALTGPSAVIASSIVGNDGISVLGPGTLLLTGVNTYAGGTFICSCDSLQLGDATHTASIINGVTNEGFFNLVNANTAGITSIINEFGGQTNFFNITNAGSATIANVFVGTTVFNDSSSAMNANITNASTGGSTLFFNNSSAGNAVITNRSSSGSIFPIGLGFFDNSTAGNATIINGGGGLIAFGIPGGTDTSTAGNSNITNGAGGHLQFDAFSTAGNATITTNSGGGVRFFDNSTGGNAQFITNGTGSVDFSGSIGPNNDGVITAGSIAGSGSYSIGPGNTLVVGGNNLSTAVSGAIDDGCGCSPGNLVKVGAGTLTLSGINTYTGTTTVNGGFLDVEGSIGSSVLTTVNAGGALTGAGIVGDTTINTGGILVPGNGPPGSFTTVAGNLSFLSGALYLVQVNSTTSTFTNVAGTATL
jgi:autotransporter-associated beta strand protein